MSARPFGLLARADDVLRGRVQVHGADSHGERLRWLLSLVALVILFGMIYGVVMGSFGGLRPLQMLYSSLKVPLLLATTFVLSIPSFFVFSTILGLRDDFAETLRALIATQAGLTIVLAALAPFTALWYASSDHYDAAKLFNLVIFGLASITAQQILRRFARPLLERDQRHAILLRGWLVMFAFVGVQMGWVLRPFIGKPDAETSFFREGAWSNAYVEVAETVMRFVSGG